MNIYKFEMKYNLKTLFFWSIGVVLFCIIALSEFSVYANDDTMLELIDSMPNFIIKAFGFDDFNFTTPQGFYGVMINYIVLLLAIHASTLGSGIVSKEERDKTVEFSLTLPITRNKVLINKILAGVSNCIVILIVLTITINTVMLQFDAGADFIEFQLLTLIPFFLTQMIFFSLGIVLSCIIRKHKKSSMFTLIILFVMYILSFVYGLSSDMKFLKFITPFKYFDYQHIYISNSVSWLMIVISIIICTWFLTIAFLSYKDRDLYI